MLDGGLKTIPDKAFAGCTNLKISKIPDSVTYIGELAFDNTAVDTVFIPSSVINVDYGIFNNCNSLTKVCFEASSLPKDWSKGWYGNITIPTIEFNQAND